MADTMATFDMVYAYKTPMFSKKFIPARLPWIQKETTANSNVGKSMVERAVHAYKTLRTKQGKGKD